MREEMSGFSAFINNAVGPNKKVTENNLIL